MYKYYKINIFIEIQCILIIPSQKIDIFEQFINSLAIM